MPQGSFAIITKIHHAAIDGMAGMEMTSAIHDHTPDAEPDEPDDDVAARADAVHDRAARPGRRSTTP